MAIYTKTGDTGTTALFDGRRVSKCSARVDTYGTFDELNAQVSVCEKLAQDPGVRNLLHQLQHKLFRLCAEIATEQVVMVEEASTLVSDQDTHDMEKTIDVYIKSLPQVHSFILSGRCLSAAEIHVARTICRRGERLLIKLSQEENIRPMVLQYVNRLSDYLYILARQEDYYDFVETVIQKVTQKAQTLMGQLILDGSQRIVDESKASLASIAETLWRGAMAKAKEIGVPMVIAIVDPVGQTVLSYRMNDALLVSSELALNKAYTAVAFKQPTHELSDSIQPGSDLFQVESMVNRKIVTFGGGFPIYYKGILLGGFGVSGGTVQEDMTVAKAALRGLEA